MLTPTTTIGAFVRERRLTRGLSQRALSDLAGVGPNFVSHLETGKSGLRTDSVERVLAVFGKRLGLEDLPRRSDTP